MNLTWFHITVMFLVVLLVIGFGLYILYLVIRALRKYLRKD